MNFQYNEQGDDFMKFNILTRKITLTEAENEYITKKLSKLDKFFKDEPEARITAGTIKDKEYIEVSIFVGGMIYRAEVTDIDIKAAADEAVDLIERQIRKNKTRLERKIKREAISDEMLLSGASYTGGEDTDEYKIVKVKRFRVKPMSPEEAILQMNLLGHSFFVFIDDVTEDTCVVYSRKDGNYGLIVPEK